MKKNNSTKMILITGGSSGIGMNLIKFFLKRILKLSTFQGPNLR